MLAFSQVDVFSSEPFLGNPVAVVHDAQEVTEDEMARFASWTNLSETTYLLPATDPAADYRLRIFTPDREALFYRISAGARAEPRRRPGRANRRAAGRG